MGGGEERATTSGLTAAQLGRRVRPRLPDAASPLAGGAGGESLRANWRRLVRRRAVITAAGLALWTVAIEARLVHLQVFQHRELVARAERQQLRTIRSPAMRGEILDRNGRLLAVSVAAASVYAVPTEIDDPDRVAARLCATLDGCDTRERQTIADRLRRQRAFAFVRRQVSPEEAKRVAALNLGGVGFLSEYRRYYPNKELAAHVLGYVGTEHQGLQGAESAYDRQIRGRPGTILIQTDARRRAFSRIERPPTAGATLELAVDEYLQHVAERELRAGVREHRAVGGTVIVMGPHSGEILALANEPTFNPNAFNRDPEDHWRNRAIQEIYEPGSTFKIVTASAALEEHVVQPHEVVDVSEGMIRLGARQIDDVHPFGLLSFADVIVKSSNVGAIKVGLRLGPERLGRYLWRFGFGQTLSRDFQGESAGIVWDPARWSDSALASVAMGYQIGVTPLQMVTAASAVANGGELLEPRLVRAFIRHNGRVETPRRVIRRAISAETAAKLTTIMEDVVARGTGRAALIPGFSVAGKTGTAAKLVNGRYSQTEYNASFVGFVPSRNPELTILVVIDTPRAGGYYGGVVAAPVFRRVAEAALRHLSVAPTINPGPAVLVARRDAAERPAPAAVRSPAVLTPVVRLAADRGLMPDLRGMSARAALRAVAHVGLSARLAGDGFVIEQEPLPGAAIDRGAGCTLRLGREPWAVSPYGPIP